MTPHPDLRALTGMRGIAAWCVVFYHIRLAVAGLDPRIVAFFSKGYLAVDFFFLLSGFVIWLSWDERLRTRRPGVVMHFLWKRLARIWPLHAVTLGATVALALVLAAAGRHDALRYPFDALPLHVVLLQNWGFTDRLAWNDPSWSISAEWGAYLGAAVLIPLADWRRAATWRILLTIAALLALLHAVMRHGGAGMLGNDIAHFGLLRCLIEFACGTCVCALWVRWRGNRRSLPRAAIATLALFAAWGADAPETLVVPAAFAALLLTLALGSGRRRHPLEIRAIVYLGEISYATYLGHFLLFVVFKLAVVDDPGAIPPILIALYLALVFGMSVSLHHLVELPAQGWMNRRDPSRRYLRNDPRVPRIFRA